MVPGGLLPTLGVPTALDSQQGAAPPWTQPGCLQAGLRRHLSPDLRSQLFLFLPSLITYSRGWDPGSRPESGPDSLTPTRTQNFIFLVPSRNGITSHLWSVPRLLQTTYCVPGIGATQQKYIHDPGKPIFCTCLKNSECAECRHQMLIFNHFLKRNMRITGVHVYTVSIQNNDDHGVSSQHFVAKKKKK